MHLILLFPLIVIDLIQPPDHLKRMSDRDEHKPGTGEENTDTAVSSTFQKGG
ncbi:hypothetical protein [Methanocalculus sp.]|uniref:hypothetical protein n=1 Tax=Methanocalculus sp. TaxID=2004547 RepID=UPI00271BBCB1|nr:hypothetical protein [Methanocalculus sp.]MDO8841151.1 hypothetical protein [Methanocalculus sp.]